MVNVTLARGGDSVEIPLLEDSGSPLIATDVGKPELDYHSNGELDPRVMDNWSGLEQYTIMGKFIGGSAFSDANSLADLIKSYSGGTDLTLSIPLSEYDSNIIVSPAAGQEESVSLGYPPGHKNHVDVELALTRVSETLGSGTDDASTPTSGGSGPIQLSNGSSTVDLSADVSVTRGLGRPQSTVRRSRNDFPTFIDKRKSAYESFSISLQYVSNARSTVQTLVNDIFRPKLGRSGLTLDFQGVFGLGSFTVVPDGSQGLRHLDAAGHKGVKKIPQINLRRVQV